MGSRGEMILCGMCGNEFVASRMVCPYCGESVTLSPPPEKKSCVQRVINLEKGMPQVEQAMERLRNELYICRLQYVRVVTLIHGYGSSGTGGLIRDEVRRYLSYLQHEGEVDDVVYGEQFHGHGGPGKQLIRRFPILSEHRDFKKNNPGITLVVL
ncbi:Smr/MutS family protein [Desulfogranum japonicum]|uniref:Smr/MutS family protein n=1 Tax=Desulfogranum japonicum TaxID=231447 RepID=UPI000413922A|nr:Smr/MutS family protein [Desulfogranum japonicum]